MADTPACVNNASIFCLQYRNECEMLKASCEMNSQLSFLHHGACTKEEEKAKLQGKIKWGIMIHF